MYVGHVAIEKNIRAFLTLKFQGTKYMVGSGPQRDNVARLFIENLSPGEP